MPSYLYGGQPDADPLSLVDLHRCSRQALEAWRSADFYVPLPVAAALAFHAGQECANGLFPKRVYEVALNLAADWLSRRVDVYVIGGSKPMVLDIAPGIGLFSDGGAVFVQRPGGHITSLGVASAQLAPVVEFISRGGTPIWIVKKRKKAAVHSRRTMPSNAENQSGVGA